MFILELRQCNISQQCITLLMKFKNEYKWLLFLIVPFIVLMVIRFIIPLCFYLYGGSLMIEEYKVNNMNMKLNTIRGNLRQKQANLNSKFQMHGNNIEMLSKYLLGESKNQYVRLNPTEPLVNAFDYRKQISSNSSLLNPPTPKPKSMWFLQHKTSLHSLSASQLSLYNQYTTNLDLYLRSLFNINQPSPTIAPNGLIKIETFLTNYDSSMYFAYPLIYDPDFANLNASVTSIKPHLQKALKLYSINNSQIWSSSLRNATTFAELIICKIISKINFVNEVSVICLTIDAYSLASKVLLRFGALATATSIDFGQNTYYLLQATTQNGQAPQVLMEVNAITFQVKYPIQQYDQSLASRTWLSLKSQHFIINRETLDNTTFAFPISIDTAWPQTQKRVLFYMMVTNTYNFNSHFIEANSAAIQVILNFILVPQLVLIVVSIILSFCIMRKVLHLIQEELTKLAQDTGFILEGDIGIQIQKYHGSAELTELYHQVKIINKLFKYTSQDYFVGHFADKILKYSQALHIFKTLSYDTSAILQNIGECYIYMEQFDQSIEFLVKSIELNLKKVHQNSAKNKKIKLLSKNDMKIKDTSQKLIKVQTIRKIFKLILVAMKYKEFQSLNLFKKNDDLAQISNQNHKKMKKLERLLDNYILLFKQVNFANFKIYSEYILVLIIEAKMQISSKKIESVRCKMIEIERLLAIYENEYDNIVKQVKKQRLKDRIFNRMHSLSSHSLLHPNIVRGTFCFLKSFFILNDSRRKIKDEYESIATLIVGAQGNILMQSSQFLLINEIKNFIENNHINLQRFEATQLFRQTFPCKTLHYGGISEENQNQFGKYTSSNKVGQERQVVMMFDCSKQLFEKGKIKRYKKAIRGHANYIFLKLTYQQDRISITRFNSNVCLQSICNLIYKQPNLHLLQKQLQDVINHHQMQGKSQIIYALQRAIHKISNLPNQKIVILFLKPLEFYIQEKINEFEKKSVRKNSVPVIEQNQKQNDRRSRLTQFQWYKQKKNSEMSLDMAKNELKRVGDKIYWMLSQCEIRNCKLILFAGGKDKYTEVRQIFGLEDINKRLWKKTNNLNVMNQIVYLIDDQHQKDLDRIMASKLYVAANQSVFIM